MNQTLVSKYDLALVTGAASRLGREIALGLAAQGYAVCVHYYHSHAEAQATVAEILSYGVPAFLISADLTNLQDVRMLFQKIDELPYQLKVLVNSAGIMEAGDISVLPPEAWDRTMDLNLKAPWLCAQEASKRMKSFGGGVIINVTDSGAHKVWTRFPVYVVSKAGLESLTRILARSMAPSIRVNAVAPGLIIQSDEISDEKWDELTQKLPMKRIGTTKNIVDTVLFLIQSEYITGQTIAVDGGYQLI